MAQTPSTWDDYVGDGVEDTFQVTFPYQKQQEVFVTVDGATAAFTFISAGWIQLAAAPASGAAIRVQRSTEAFEPRHEFANGVPLLPRFIDENNTQFLYVVQEATNETAGTAAEALSQASQAVATADAAAALIDDALQDSALYLRNDLANSTDPAKGAGLVGYLPTWAGAQGRTLSNKLSDYTSVSDFGAGAAASSATFQSAVDSTVGFDYQGAHSPVLKAKVKEVIVPGETYTLADNVTSPDKVVWTLSPNTDIDESKLTGTVHKPGVHINSIHTGILENATTFSLRAGRKLDRVGGVYGITTEDTISRVGPPHSVTLQIDNASDIVPLTLTGTTYTATTVTYTNEVDLSDVKTGATITSLGVPSHTAIITSVDQGSKTITVAGGWRPFTGVIGATGTPTNGVDAAIDYFSKLWGQNTNVFLAAGHPTRKAVGYELGVLNYQSDAPIFNPTVEQTPSLWGFDAVNLGTFKASAGFLARSGGSAWRTGFVSYGNEIGFEVREKTASPNSVAFAADIENGQAIRVRRGGQPCFAVQSTGSMEIGRQDAAQVTTIDLHSSGLVNDFDVRLQASGGGAASGAGTLLMRAAVIHSAGALRPELDNAVDNGSAAQRWRDTFTGNIRPGSGAPIWTSGTGSPEGVLSAVVGSLYTRTDGGAGTTLYVKEAGGGATGWVAK
jgi:hypothetical protein